MTSSATPDPALSSTPSERDARARLSDPSEVAPGDIAVGVVIGRTSEYFDYFVYGIASVLVFPFIFFPFESRLDGTLLSFVVFSFAFIARPIGTVVFMEIQRRWGRGTKLTLALFAARDLDGGHCFPARIRRSWLHGDRAARGLPRRPGHRAWGFLGWTAVAAGPECAAAPPRLVRDDGAARSPGGLHVGERTLLAAVCHAVAGRFPFVGLALSLLLRLRDQRGRVVRTSAPGGCGRIRATFHRQGVGAQHGRRIAAFRRLTT